MPRKARFFLFLVVAILCFAAAGGVTLNEMGQYDHSLGFFPAGTIVAGIPIGGLDAQSAGARLAQAYALTPVELRIDEDPIHIDPTTAGLKLDVGAMIQAANKALGQRTYWQGLWDYLWNRKPAPVEAPLVCSVDAQQLHAYLAAQVGSRYDHPAQAAHPSAIADVQYQAGQPGATLDLTGAEPSIRDALCARSPRTVELHTSAVGAQPPSIDELGLLLQSLVQASTTSFDGAIEVYYQDLSTGKEINFAYNQGHEIPPGIAFTAASTIKIPVLVSAYKHLDGPIPDDLAYQMGRMIDLSDNGSTDEVMKRVLDPNIAPVQVTQDMQALGLKNTFLAGFFYPGAPLLNRYNTPANQRTDVSTDPDVYNQTTTADMGRLLAAIDRCAASGTGPLIDAFPGKITQAKCVEMAGLLAKNRKGVLIEAGVPEGTLIEHKYGWVTDPADGLMHTASDAAIVGTPGGKFILTIYLYHHDQLQWDPAQRLAARLATAVYNFYNQWK